MNLIIYNNILYAKIEENTTIIDPECLNTGWFDYSYYNISLLILLILSVFVYFLIQSNISEIPKIDLDELFVLAYQLVTINLREDPSIINRIPFIIEQIHSYLNSLNINDYSNIDEVIRIVEFIIKTAGL